MTVLCPGFVDGAKTLKGMGSSRLDSSLIRLVCDAFRRSKKRVGRKLLPLARVTV